MSGERRTRLAGATAAALWALLCLRWFDPGEALRPAWLRALPPWALVMPALAAGGIWLDGRRRLVWGPPLGPAARGLRLVLALAAAFRLPLLWLGAAGYTTADGALSGIVAIRLREGLEHLVFVPHVPYSGSLKSHLTAALSLLVETPRAFTLASLFFYLVFVAALYRLALLVAGRGRSAESLATLAGLYVAFAPPFVTRYSLSNDGNYVEVLALGTWALLLAARWAAEPLERPRLALLAGLALGLAFWCHILAILYAATVGLFLIAVGRGQSLRSIPGALSGFVLGYLPGLLWNATNGWQSLAYVIPGGQHVAGLERPVSALERARLLLADQWPVLLGYDLGYPPLLDRVFFVLAMLAVACAWGAVFVAIRAVRRGAPGTLVLLLGFAAVNSLIAFVALPQLPANPRYLLFLMTPLPILLARCLGSGRRLWLFGLLVALGASGSLAQFPATARRDHRLRELVAVLEREGVRHCYSDFYLATPISFLSEERIVCSAKLGPTTTEYFFDYRRAVEAAGSAALVAVNQANAAKLERKLERLGVSYERVDVMKPVLLRLSRKVDPEELFPGREFPWR
jgi:hypothetical protein